MGYYNQHDITQKHVKKGKQPLNPENAEVALESPVVKENLPLPLVFYPNQYGIFFAFGSSRSELPALCECAKGAVKNCLQLQEKFDKGDYSDPRVTAPLSSRDFPNCLSEDSLRRQSNPMEWLRFEAKICHRCNLATPSLRYCVDMYGGQFKQYYGWYINQTTYRLGVLPLRYRYLKNVCPSEVIDQIEAAKEVTREEQLEQERLMKLVKGSPRPDILPNEITYWHNVKLEEAEPFRRLEKLSRQLWRGLENRFENITREEFGFRKIGEGWVSESMLFKIVSRLLPGETIIRHHRPEWLEGLELDIFVPGQSLGFEYQGQQHFHPIKAWGGQRALARLQERDTRKRKLCHYYGVRLIAIDYTEPLTEDHISARLCAENGPAEHT